MASFQDIADKYAKRIHAGASAADIAKEINSLVYENTQTPLSASDKAKIVALTKTHFENHSPVPGKPGVVYIRDSDNRAYLALVAQLYALLGIK